MGTQSSMLHVRMDSELKQKATETLAAMGLSASDAVRLLFHRIAVDRAFPLELKVPNARTQRAMAEVDEMVKTRKARFASADEMFAELESDRKRCPARSRTEGSPAERRVGEPSGMPYRRRFSVDLSH